MRPDTLYITTSWDDGHPLDFRLADLLAKYRIPATFYVPIQNERPVLKAQEISALSDEFEIGGHTMTHCDLRKIPMSAARREIEDCKKALENITGKPCSSFCFPMGRFRRQHLLTVRDAGFHVARTVELMSIEAPRMTEGVVLMPTSLQAMQTTPSALIRNALKRGRAGNLLRYFMLQKESWVESSKALLENAASGGVFHLWGHSWEIEEFGQWKNLESIFASIAEYRGRAVFGTNAELGARISG